MDRSLSLRLWLASVLGDGLELKAASADASFRRYWRVQRGEQTWIAMDAPPEHEDCMRYIRLARLLRAHGVNTPEIYAEDVARGFLLLSDLGERRYLDELNESTVDPLYADALAILRLFQTRVPGAGLPEYDAPFFRREIDLFRTWLLEGLLGFNLTAPEHLQLDQVASLLIRNALEQPRVFVHRDYHSRNLMVTECNNPGVLDFQDAVVGPIAYDLVSLLRDCYIAWCPERVWGWALGHFEQLRALGLLTGVDEGRFRRWFDLMGAQRHLKAAGIFARLSLRDGKHGYLSAIPRTLGYVVEVCRRYPELFGFGDWLEARVLPALPR